MEENKKIDWDVIQTALIIIHYSSTGERNMHRLTQIAKARLEILKGCIKEKPLNTQEYERIISALPDDTFLRSEIQKKQENKAFGKNIIHFIATELVTIAEVHSDNMREKNMRDLTSERHRNTGNNLQLGHRRKGIVRT